MLEGTFSHVAPYFIFIIVNVLSVGVYKLRKSKILPVSFFFIYFRKYCLYLFSLYISVNLRVASEKATIELLLCFLYIQCASMCCLMYKLYIYRYHVSKSFVSACRSNYNLVR